MYQTGDTRERHIPGKPLTNQEKAIVGLFFTFIILIIGGLIALIVIETDHATECGGAVTNTANAPKPTPPPGKA